MSDSLGQAYNNDVMWDLDHQVETILVTDMLLICLTLCNIYGLFFSMDIYEEFRCKSL